MIFITALRKEWLELVRSSRLVILLAVFLGFGLTSPLLAKYTPEILGLVPGAEAFAGLIPEPTLLDSVGQFIKNTYQFGLLLALLLTMGVVAQEKDKGTAAMVLVKPLPRSTFIFAKFITLALAFFGSLAIASLGAWYYTLTLFEAPDVSAWATMTALIWLLLMVYVAITLFFSTLMRSQAAAAGMAFGIFLVFSLIGSFPTLAEYLPGYLLIWAGATFIPGSEPAWVALGVSLGIILASLLAAWLVFERQEL
jgi:ABC-2 type transport system permease protein